MHDINWKRCVGISTDGAPAMCGVRKGVAVRIKEVAPECKSTHCYIHREQLAVKNMPTELESVLKEVVKIVNLIKSRPLNVRLFKVLCEEMGSHYKNLLFHTEVRWLSRGKVLTRFFELRNELMKFLHDSDNVNENFFNFKWLVKVAYLSDIFNILNNLNLSLQGRNISIFTVEDKISGLITKTELWCTRLDRREYDSFPTLDDVLASSEEGINDELLGTFKTHVQMMQQNLKKYFPEPDVTKEWIRNPFAAISQIDSFNLPSCECDMLADIASDRALKQCFIEKSLQNFWVHVQAEYPALSERALKHLLPFPTTYNCEFGFSNLVEMKSKKRNRLNVEADLRLKMSTIEPDVDNLVKKLKQYHHSH